jgi:hypothetical protein
VHFRKYPSSIKLFISLRIYSCKFCYFISICLGLRICCMCFIDFYLFLSLAYLLSILVFIINLLDLLTDFQFRDSKKIYISQRCKICTVFCSPLLLHVLTLSTTLTSNDELTSKLRLYRLDGRDASVRNHRE